MNNNKNNTGKRVLAIIGIIILLGLYIVTLLLAVLGDESTHTLFMASICATILVPIMLWIYSWLYKLLKKEVSDSRSNNINNDNNSHNN